MQSFEVQHFMVPAMMMIGQSQEGDSQADQRHDGEENQHEDERLVHLVKMQLDNPPRRVASRPTVCP